MTISIQIGVPDSVAIAPYLYVRYTADQGPTALATSLEPWAMDIIIAETT